MSLWLSTHTRTYVHIAFPNLQTAVSIRMSDSVFFKYQAFQNQWQLLEEGLLATDNLGLSLMSLEHPKPSASVFELSMGIWRS